LPGKGAAQKVREWVNIAGLSWENFGEIDVV